MWENRATPDLFLIECDDTNCNDINLKIITFFKINRKSYCFRNFRFSLCFHIFRCPVHDLTIFGKYMFICLPICIKTFMLTLTRDVMNKISWNFRFTCSLTWKWTKNFFNILRIRDDINITCVDASQWGALQCHFYFLLYK